MLRCESPDGTVIVKAYQDTPEVVAAFANEAAALELGVGPDLLIVDSAARIIVMADLGSGPSLGDLLYGDDGSAAADGLIAWAATLGKLAADTAHRRKEFDELRARHGTEHPEILGVAWFHEVLAELPAVFAAVGVEQATGFDAEVATLLDDRYYALSPGDACAGNNMITAAGLRLLDFEYAGYRPVFLDAAYCRVPFPTCWDVRRLPPTLATQAEETYRTEIVRAHPDLAEDAIWHHGVRGAAVAWALINTTALPAAAEKDTYRGPPERAPTWRQLLLHRWETLAAIDDLPAIGETARRLLSATESWNTPPLSGYPALSGHEQV